MARRRPPALLAAVAASAVLASGYTSVGTTRPPAVTEQAVATRSFSAMGLAFGYPAAWRSGTWSDDVSSFTALIVYLTTGPLRDPCTVTTSPGRTTVACAAPVRKLPPGGVLVSWSAYGFPVHGPLPKPNTTIAGRPSVETKTGGGWCAQLGGTETITVTIPRNAPDNWYQMNACLRAPGLTRQETEITTMLTSLRIARGD